MNARCDLEAFQAVAQDAETRWYDLDATKISINNETPKTIEDYFCAILMIQGVFPFLQS